MTIKPDNEQITLLLSILEDAGLDPNYDLAKSVIFVASSIVVAENIDPADNFVYIDEAFEYAQKAVLLALMKQLVDSLG